MELFSIFLALVIEQARPMSPSHFLHQWLRRWADWVAYSHVDGGTPSQAWMARGLLVGVPAGLAAAIHWLLAYAVGWLFAVAWNVVLLLRHPWGLDDLAICTSLESGCAERR
jgi:adenosylcobinamide-phosphate synthase